MAPIRLEPRVLPTAVPGSVGRGGAEVEADTPVVSTRIAFRNVGPVPRGTSPQLAGWLEGTASLAGKNPEKEVVRVEGIGLHDLSLTNGAVQNNGRKVRKNSSAEPVEAEKSLRLIFSSPERAAFSSPEMG